MSDSYWAQATSKRLTPYTLHTELYDCHYILSYYAAVIIIVGVYN